jgi:hypothetical protein
MIKDAILKEKAKVGQKVVIANSIRISRYKIDDQMRRPQRAIRSDITDIVKESQKRIKKALIEAFQHVAKEARKTYQRVFGTTILPGGYSHQQAEQRRIVNTWMLDQGKN